jgi:hypothetical protein
MARAKAFLRSQGDDRDERADHLVQAPRRIEAAMDAIMRNDEEAKDVRA